MYDQNSAPSQEQRPNISPPKPEKPSVGLISPLRPANHVPTPPGPEDIQSFVWHSAPDPDVDRGFMQLTKELILDLRLQRDKDLRIMKEKEQHVRDLDEKIAYAKVILGSGKASSQNTFDDHSPPIFDNTADQFGSPGAMTLVDFGPEEAIGHEVVTALPIEAEVLDVPSTPDADSELEDAEDVPMHELITDPLHYDIDQVFIEIRKRKRSSKHASSKKVRIHNKAQVGSTISPPPSRVRQQNADAPCDFHSNGGNTEQDEVDDGSKPPVTTRPTSWPRSRLFRRSAGVSVKKLTDAFEKLRWKQN